jgi:hypothetical protein
MKIINSIPLIKNMLLLKYIYIIMIDYLLQCVWDGEKFRISNVRKFSFNGDKVRKDF